jgi:hypothetical protein
MNEDIEKYKRYNLQKNYQNITTTIINLENHLNSLSSLNILSNKTLWRLNEELYNIIKNLNTDYNNEIR